ncbi:hypothetical protein NDU88_001840 [Pleurodeles waltl]|uniref:Nuclease HARBI1 n=1 Tax=Pleurodeles waltl TaxID=8319 RepID=A0AAV7VC49_PLEWA|nr:hypothetical protein NDU88_001840 [Pleurodeles waltl]
MSECLRLCTLGRGRDTVGEDTGDVCMAAVEVSASEVCVLLCVVVMLVVHASVSVDRTGREVEEEEEGETVEIVDIGESLCYSPKKVCQIVVACCMLHNLALRRYVPFLQEEEEAGDAHVAAVDPLDSEDEVAEDEGEDNRTAVIRQYFQ